MSSRTVLATLAVLVGFGLQLPVLFADPCGMVPPIYQGQGPPITRIGEQQTFVFYKDGVESFVIRPGFSGKVEQFGMLIPFPTPPAVRKVPDHIFPHIAAAVDPPEVVIDIRPILLEAAAADFDAGAANGAPGLRVRRDEVRVLSQEAVGMYEVAVLEAGSAAALKRWMDEHGYRFPKGMDKVTNEYVDDGWCFVAVKTQVGPKGSVDPRPGQRTVDAALPAGATFDGFVQAMGFRFKTDKLVVPMRLSAFNDGELRNIVYLLTDGPRRVRAIPEEYVMRQIPGEQMFRNVTDPLPLRIIGGTEKDLQDWHRQGLAERRNPYPRNGAAKELFASDLMAIRSGQLSLPQEEQEKELLAIGERLQLRGGDIDSLNSEALKSQMQQTINKALTDIKEMTMTVVDGDFPREVLAGQNLTFAEYRMPQRRNSPKFYDANLKGPAPAKEGVLKLGALQPSAPSTKSLAAIGDRPWLTAGVVFAFFGLGLLASCRAGRAVRTLSMMFAAALVLLAAQYAAAADAASPQDLVAKLGDVKTAQAAVESLVAYAAKGNPQRAEAVKLLSAAAGQGEEMAPRGWAIAALGDIGGQDIDEMLLEIHADDSQPMLVRTWAAAARVKMTRSAAGLVEKAALIQTFPALGRPIGMRLVEQLNSDSGEVTAEGLLKVTLQVPTLQQSLGPAILALGSEKLATALVSASDQNIRRQAAGYLGALAGQGDTRVSGRVVNAYRFDVEARDVPWRGGPLFLPGIAWQKEDATALVGNLIRWHLWCDRNDRTEEKNQIHNNLQSLGLFRVVGYQPPGQPTDTVAWLTAWGKTVGRAEMEQLLKEQGVEKNKKYTAALEGLN